MQDARAAAFRVRRACAMLSKSKGNVWAMCARSVYCEVAAVVRCLSMRSKYVIGKSTYKFLPYTGVGERQRVRRSSRATRAQSARSPVLASRFTAWHPPARDAFPSPFLLRLRPHPGVSPASWIPRSPRLPETGNLAASEHADPDARSAVRVRRRFLACLGGGASGCGSERVLSEETIRPAPARCGPGPFRPVRLRFQDSTSGARAAAAGADGAV